MIIKYITNQEYLENLLEKRNYKDMSYMELNLETWRQLWRVLEMSDIVVLITDVRHPVRLSIFSVGLSFVADINRSH